MSMKRIASLALSAALALTLAPAARAASAYADVRKSDWYYEAVEDCRERGLMSGVDDDHFAPDAPMTRATAVTVLYRLAGAPAVSEDTGFTDVEAGKWYTQAVSWAARTGLVVGTGYGYFSVDDPMTREQLALVLWRYAGSPESPEAEPFSDSGAISSYAASAVNWARANGVIGGQPGNRFDPQGTATRAQLAQILSNFSRSAASRVAPSYLSEMDVMCAPADAAMSDGGLLLVTDTYHRVVWQVRDGVASIYAGVSSGRVSDESEGGYRDVSLDESLFRSPWAITPFLDGWAVSDPENNVVRLLRFTGVETVNARTEEDLPTNDMGVTYEHPTGLATDEDGNLYIADTHRGAIRRVTPEGVLNTVVEGLNDPMGLCWYKGALYCCETGANRVIRVVDGGFSVVAGSGEEGYLDGENAVARFSAPQAMTAGSDGTLYVSDTANGAVRRIRAGYVSTLIAQDGALEGSVPLWPLGLMEYRGTLYICDNFSRKVFTIPVD